MATTRGRCDGSTMRLAGSGGGAWRRSALILSGLGAVALLAAACSSSANTNSSSAAGGSSTTGSTGTAAVVKVMTVPTYGKILVDSRGMPLYTVTGSCTGSCTSAWPPLTVAAGTTPTGAAGTGGTLAAVKQANGTYQVTWNGSPLYTFVSDASGQVTGQGVAGFSVVKVSGSTTPTASTTSAPSHSGY